jgi:hypothetical protein
MATTAAQRVRAHRTRRRRREVQLTIEVSEIDLREIALRSYADATSTDRKAREVAVALFVSDQCVPAGPVTALQVTALQA